MNDEHLEQKTGPSGTDTPTPETNAAWDGYNKADDRSDGLRSRYETSRTLERQRDEARKEVHRLVTSGELNELQRLNQQLDQMRRERDEAQTNALRLAEESDAEAAKWTGLLNLFHAKDAKRFNEITRHQNWVNLILTEFIESICADRDRHAQDLQGVREELERKDSRLRFVAELLRGLPDPDLSGFTEERCRQLDSSVTMAIRELESECKDYFPKYVEALTKERDSLRNTLADTQRQLADAERIIARAIPAVERAFPQPSHKGPCGPEAGCDGNCMEIASLSELLADMLRIPSPAPTRAAQPAQPEL